jgi:Flp pilus assembly protein TadG
MNKSVYLGVCRSRRGISAIYVAMILLVIFGFVALGIDIGRMQLAKTELQGAADAAARAGATQVRHSRANARASALSLAAANTCVGQAVALQVDEDVEIGLWDKSTRVFTVLPEGDPQTPNAVRVTSRRIAARNSAVPLIFAPVIGHNTSDIQAVAVAHITTRSYTYGIVGIDYIKMNGVTTTDSYDSRAGPYDPNSPGANGDIVSNGPITLVGQAQVNGDANPGPDDQVNMTSNAGVTGNTEPLPEELVFPPVDPGPYAAANNNAALPPSVYTAGTRDFNLNGAFTLAGGSTDYVKYYFNNFTVGAQAKLTVTGKVEICVTGQFKIAGGVTTANNNPGNFRIRVAGPGDVSISGTSDLYADVYAPEAPCTFNGLGNPRNPLGLFGTLVGKSLTVNGNSDLHYDEALAKEVELPGKVVLVK